MCYLPFVRCSIKIFPNASQKKRKLAMAFSANASDSRLLLQNHWLSHTALLILVWNWWTDVSSAVTNPFDLFLNDPNLAEKLSFSGVIDKDWTNAAHTFHEGFSYSIILKCQLFKAIATPSLYYADNFLSCPRYWHYSYVFFNVSCHHSYLWCLF